MAFPEGFNTGSEKGEIPSNFNIAFLVSPRSSASNFRAILAEVGNPDFHGVVNLAIADTESAPGLKIARDNQIRAVALPYKRSEQIDAKSYRDIYSAQVGRLMKSSNVDVAVMAGFNRILTQPYFGEFQGSTLNIHPGAIPDSKDTLFFFEDGTEAPWNQGKMMEDAVSNFLPLKYAASTIHIATVEADFGPVLKRVIVPVEHGDTVESLYARLKVVEQQGLIEVLKNLHFKDGNSRV